MSSYKWISVLDLNFQTEQIGFDTWFFVGIYLSAKVSNIPLVVTYD